MPKPSEFLRRGWTKNADARDEQGNVVPARSGNAVSWCIRGAFIAAECNLDPLYAYLPGFLQRLGFSRDGISVADWNDLYATKEQVLALVEEYELNVLDRID